MSEPGLLVLICMILAALFGGFALAESLIPAPRESVSLQPQSA